MHACTGMCITNEAHAYTAAYTWERRALLHAHLQPAVAALHCDVARSPTHAAQHAHTLSCAGMHTHTPTPPRAHLHHLALLSDAEGALHAAWRLALDGQVGGAAAAAHRAAAAVEQRQLHVVLVHDGHQLLLRGMRMCACLCVRTRVRACVRACVRGCARMRFGCRVQATHVQQGYLASSYLLFIEVKTRMHTCPHPNVHAHTGTLTLMLTGTCRHRHTHTHRGTDACVYTHLAAVQRPVGGHPAGVLATIAVAQHDLLRVAVRGGHVVAIPARARNRG